MSSPFCTPSTISILVQLSERIGKVSSPDSNIEENEEALLEDERQFLVGIRQELLHSMGIHGDCCHTGGEDAQD